MRQGTLLTSLSRSRRVAVAATQVNGGCFPVASSSGSSSPAGSSDGGEDSPESDPPPADPPAGSGEPQATGSVFERRLALVTNTLAPATLITAVLFYFGYVTAGREYAYFGLSSQILGFSSQDYLMRGFAALYAPLVVVIFAGLMLTWGHGALADFLQVDRDQLAAGRVQLAVRIASTLLMSIGAAFSVRGLVGIFFPVLSATEPIATTPLSLAVGVLVLSYGRHLLTRFGFGSSHRGVFSRRLEQAVTAGVGALVVLSAFWAVNSYAAAYGCAEAFRQGRALHELPAVVLDSKDELSIRYRGIHESPLIDSDLRHRYTGLRLLLASNGKLFLIPDHWSHVDGAAVVLADNDSIRIQLYGT